MVDSPDVLQIKGSAPRSARLNRKAAFAVIGLVTFGLLFIVFEVATRKPPGSDLAGDKPLHFAPATSVASGITAKVPDAFPPPTPIPPAPAPVPPGQVAQVPPIDRGPPPPRVKTRAEINADDLAESRRRSAEAARTADTAIEFSVDGRAARASTSSLPGNLQNLASSLAGAVPGGGQALPDPSGAAGRVPDQATIAQSLARSAGLSAGNPGSSTADQNGQESKEAFFAKAETQADSPYLQHVRKDAITPLVLSAGTIIPCELIGGLNSDLPGEISALVRQNVYDSPTGNHLLIPQGAKIFGRYDSQVTYGQDGVNAVWPRMSFPDGSTLELDSMRGYDQEGNAGFRDQVNNHYGRIIGAAILSSVFSAGVELSQLQQQAPTGTNGISTSNQIGQTVGSSVGQNVAELGAEVTRKNLNVQPTLNIRKGYLFNVLVNKDIAFPKDYKE